MAIRAKNRKAYIWHLLNLWSKFKIISHGVLFNIKIDQMVPLCRTKCLTCPKFKIIIHYTAVDGTPSHIQNIASVPSTSCDLSTSMKLLGGDAFRRKKWPWPQGYIAQYSLHHLTYASAKFEVARSNGLGGAFTRNTLFDLDLWVKVTENIPHYPLHHVTYVFAKFEVATSNGQRGAALTRKYIFWPLSLTLGSRSYIMLLTTLYIMWPMHLRSLKLLGPMV